jgi:hypothetical protein
LSVAVGWEGCDGESFEGSVKDGREIGRVEARTSCIVLSGVEVVGLVDTTVVVCSSGVGCDTEDGDAGSVSLDSGTVLRPAGGGGGGEEIGIGLFAMSWSGTLD